MTEAEKIIYAAVVGLVIWIIQKVISFVVIRGRITQSILTDIKLNIGQIKEAYDYLKKYEQQALVQGKKLAYVDQFTKTEHSFFKSQLQDLPKYYRRKTLDKMSKFYYSFWELQILIEGLMAYLKHLFESGTQLSPTEIDRAKKKFARIYKLMELIINNEVKNLSDLIENYEGRLAPDSML